MIIFTLRRILLLIVTLFLLTFVGFSLSYFTPHAPLQGASLWNAWVFWFNGLIHWDFGVSSINGQPIAEQLFTHARLVARFRAFRSALRSETDYRFCVD